ncbi:MAG: phage portal protein [Paludibacteraceae bacterium]|nr:phage portal protein [Paludibacteraceae bacterium]
MNPTLIGRYIEHNRVEAARRANLFNYYNGKHAIANRHYEDDTKPNNKITNPYPHYITDTITGYFIGEPVTYKMLDAELNNTLAAIMKYNDEASENAELAKCCSVCGVAYEMLWIDAEGEIRFTNVNPIDGIAIYDTDIDPEMLYFLRYYKDYDIVSNQDVEYVECYSRNDYRLYRRSVAAYELVEQRAHSFGMVPVIEYKNNAELSGDFELVISLIDAYDAMESDNVNDADYLADAYLMLKGMMGTTSDDIAAMKQNRVLLLENDSDAAWLTKNINDSQSENMKVRIDRDIHKLSFCPDLSDENFASNASGVAIRYKLLGLENLTAKKESLFKKGLQKRLEIICNYLAMLGTAYDYTTVEIVFTRNLPTNLEEVATTINQIGHLLSEETQLSMLPLDIDYAAEQERKKAEKEAGYDDYVIGGDVE